MIVAVASADFLRVSGHAGKARRFLVFKAEDDGRLRELRRVELKREMVFHHYKKNFEPGDPHPLSDIQALIATSSGMSFLNRMKRRGVDAVLTAESDPIEAVRAYLTQRLTPPKPRPITGLICKVKDAFSGGA